MTVLSTVLIKRAATATVAIFKGYPGDENAPKWLSEIASRHPGHLKFLCSVPWVWDQVHAVMLHSVDDVTKDISKELRPWWTIRRYLDDILVSFLVPFPSRRLSIAPSRACTVSPKRTIERCGTVLPVHARGQYVVIVHTKLS